MIENKIEKLLKKRTNLKKEYFTIEEAKEYSSISSEISAYKMALELRKKDNKKSLFSKINFSNPKIIEYV
jgi:hypothetical protein